MYSVKPIFCISLFSLSLALLAQSNINLSKQIVLPPVAEFRGSSLSLMADSTDPWVTPGELKGLEDTPSYDETMSYLQKLAAASPSLKMVSLGKSREGRDFWMVIASNRSLFEPDQIIQSGQPVLLVQAGIHSGEIDGKDAGLMLLRDMTVKGHKKELLDSVIMLFVPILNVDGHERRGPFNRINQRGPQNMGWRTNAANLNLNRDYTKVDTEGIRAILGCIRTYKPNLYFDIHVTDGVDYQYDVTFGANGTRGFSPASGMFLEQTLFPELNKALLTAGHIPGPLIFAKDNTDLNKGIIAWSASPRFSNGYGDLIHLPTVLVENHSLKSFKQRVLGSYVLLEQTLESLKVHGAELMKAQVMDRDRRTPRIPTKWGFRENTVPMKFLAITNESYLSEITGNQEVRWLGEPITLNIPVHYMDVPKDFVQKPIAYWVPGSWKEIISRIKIHGIQFEEVPGQPKKMLSRLKFRDPKFSESIYEGHFTVKSDFVEFRQEDTFPLGTVRVPVDQPLGDLVMVLLDPRFQDSFFQWGFFNQIFQKTEYTEAYAIEPYARQMLEDSQIKEAFQNKLKDDEAFRNNAEARLSWFYEKTQYSDQNWKVYPVGIEN